MTEKGGDRAYGRRTFLAVTAGGLSSLLWAKPVWRTVSGAPPDVPGTRRAVRGTAASKQNVPSWNSTVSVPPIAARRASMFSSPTPSR